MRLLMNLALIQNGYQLAVISPICRAEYNGFINIKRNTSVTVDPSKWQKAISGIGNTGVTKDIICGDSKGVKGKDRQRLKYFISEKYDKKKARRSLPFFLPLNGFEPLIGALRAFVGFESAVFG